MGGVFHWRAKITSLHTFDTDVQVQRLEVAQGHHDAEVIQVEAGGALKPAR
jgi:hypothetical protein